MEKLNFLDLFPVAGLKIEALWQKQANWKDSGVLHVKNWSLCKGAVYPNRKMVALKGQRKAKGGTAGLYAPCPCPTLRPPMEDQVPSACEVIRGQAEETGGGLRRLLLE